MSVEKENINKEQITEDLNNQIMDDLKRYENELYIKDKNKIEHLCE